jgi:hypothetical protein
MWVLEQPWVLRRGSVLAGTPLALIVFLGAAWLAIASLARAGWMSAEALGVVTLTATHGGLLVTALAWGEADSGIRLPAGAGGIAIGLIAVGAAAAAIHGWGSVAFLGTPVWLAVLAFRQRLTGLGFGPACPMRPLLIGALIGACLGGHLLFSASQTLGYPLRGGGVLALLALWSYDVGANVLSAECFFRGALFNRLQRRWSFVPAAALSTALSLLRYLADPLLPGKTEVVVGALFYATILGVINCWLLWWSGSLAPGLLAAALFFLAYRALAIG